MAIVRRFPRGVLCLENWPQIVCCLALVLVAWRGLLAGAPAEDAQPAQRATFEKPAEPSNENPPPALPISGSRKLLSELGMEVGLLDDLVGSGQYEDDKELTGRQRECFYQMLAAAGRAKPGQLLRSASIKEAEKLLRKAPKELKGPARCDEFCKESSLAPLCDEPNKHRGRLVVLSGTARRVMRVEIDDPDVAARFGFDHYYQMTVFTDDSPGNRVVFCVRELPELMPTAEGAGYGKRVRVAGFFLMTWSYPVEAPGEAPDARDPNGARPQLVPLLIGRKPVWYPGPRDKLRTREVHVSQYENVTDFQPVDDNEIKTLLEVMYWACNAGAIREFPLTYVEQWAHDELNLAELVKDPEASRVEFFRLSGRVTRVEVRRPKEEKDRRRLEMEQYYRCEFMLSDEQPALIFTPTVPKQWRQGGAAVPISKGQRASAIGLLFKFAGQDPRRPVPVFVASRVAWHPNTPLGDLGMDVGLLDDVKTRGRLTGEDRNRYRECFYQMLAAVGRAKPGQLLREAEDLLRDAPEDLKQPARLPKQRDEFSVVPLFLQPETQRGRLVVLEGTARRVLRVRVDGPDIVARFGIDHYYEMTVFTGDSQDNPLVFCVRSLPEGMPTGADPEFSEHVRVAGFFLKKWAYRVEPTAERPTLPSGRPPRRYAPLLIGREPVWYPHKPPGTNPLAGAIAGGLFVLALLGIWVALWQYGRSDKQFRDRTIAKTYSLDSGVSLNEIGLDAEGNPDFSALEGIERGDAEKKGD